jgi:hypothetical protein
MSRRRPRSAHITTESTSRDRHVTASVPPAVPPPARADVRAEPTASSYLGVLAGLYIVGVPLGVVGFIVGFILGILVDGILGTDAGMGIGPSAGVVYVLGLLLADNPIPYRLVGAALLTVVVVAGLILAGLSAAFLAGALGGITFGFLSGPDERVQAERRPRLPSPIVWAGIGLAGALPYLFIRDMFSSLG